MKLTVNLQGGLGNQMYQIVFILAMGIKYDCIVELPNFKGAKSKRKKFPPYWNSIFKNVSKLINCTQNYVNVNEQHHFFYDIIPKESVRYTGYFQSYKYFDNYKQQIFDMFDIKSLKQDFINKYDYSFDNVTSIHFRISDYKFLQHVHNVLDNSYYIDALQKLSECTNLEGMTFLYFFEKCDIVVVTERIKYIKNHFEKNNVIIDFVPINHEWQDWEQLIAMSLCKNNIIANSTFSWWGAYLNEYSDKVVIAPKTWFGPKGPIYKLDDILLKTWHAV